MKYCVIRNKIERTFKTGNQEDNNREVRDVQMAERTPQINRRPKAEEPSWSTTNLR